MLYKASTQPSVDARTPVKTVTRTIHRVAKALGAGSSVRGMLEWARENPTPFYTQLYKATIERDINVKLGLDESLTGLLAQAFVPQLTSEPVAVIAAPVDSTIEVNGNGKDSPECQETRAETPLDEA